ncbi:MAG: thioredoxin family protein [Rhodospirillales bacterium]|nr:thioredoxin family protein [Rhodospirillales bacterium]
MSVAPPSICDFGWKAVDFELPGIDGQRHTLESVRGANGTVVMFICNHCPYVKSIGTRLAEDIRALQAKGIGAVAIMSNDTDGYPEDSFDNMKIYAGKYGFSFPYVIDKTQEIGRAYDAKCTPDFFGFNADLELQYRGRLDDSGSRPPKPDSRRELVEAMEQIARTGKGPTDQIASIGCSIKWR